MTTTKDEAPGNPWEADEDLGPLLAEWKASTKDRPGLASVVESTPALRCLVEVWAALEHRPIRSQKRKRGELYVRLWRCHDIDLLEAADLAGLEAHVVLRMYDRASRMGVLYPDGTLHPDVQDYLDRIGRTAGKQRGEINVNVGAPVRPIGFQPEE